jgi:hypothetical protein
MVNGELKCIRYYPYFDMGFALLKKLLIESCHFIARGEQKLTLSKKQKQFINSSTDLDAVYAIIGEDFWVVCPCMSSVHNGVLLEGTRLTLCKKVTGYDFSIRTPGLPSRWKAMENELSACFASIVKQLTLLKKINKTENKTPSNKKICDVANEQLIREALRLFYYWVNFAPLTRGSAMCGYAALMAVILASNRIITSSIPTGKQLDWEAIFTANSNDFIDKFVNEIQVMPSDFSLSEDVDFESAMPSLYDALQALLVI